MKACIQTLLAFFTSIWITNFRMRESLKLFRKRLRLNRILWQIHFQLSWLAWTVRWWTNTLSSLPIVFFSHLVFQPSTMSKILSNGWTWSHFKEKLISLRKELGIIKRLVSKIITTIRIPENSVSMLRMKTSENIELSTDLAVQYSDANIRQALISNSNSSVF